MSDKPQPGSSSQAANRKVSAQQVYALLSPHQLTEEQRIAVEQAPTDAPSLVVAGAGSGKTELMAVRVLWLVANEICRPEEILGLTFTRKAANELSKRIWGALLKLRDESNGLWPESLGYEFVQPTISTYNSYANSLFRDFALAIGYEPESTLLTEAGAYQLAREVIVRFGHEVDERLADADQELKSMIESVLNLAGQLNDNQSTAEQVRELIEEAETHLRNLPRTDKKLGPYAKVGEALDKIRNTPLLAALAERFMLEKRRRSLVDYSDQVALAEQVVREVPAARERERQSFSQILLDEYQDTSVLQTRLLAGLFSGKAVFAVGDPNQSIYGWRGASASNLASFGSDFGQEQRFELSTSWRNPTTVLGLANALAAELSVQPNYLKGAAALSNLQPVQLRAAPAAVEGRIEVEMLETIEDEARRIADWFVASPMTDKKALLMRKRRNMPLFVDALEQRGHTVDVVGLGGLLEMPEVTDLVCALKVIQYPHAGSQLIRLLAGPRWRLGTADLAGLSRFAKFAAKHLDGGLGGEHEDGVAPEDSASIVDALDLLREPYHQGKIAAWVSDAGLVRLIDAAELFARLRQRTGMGLVEFTRLALEELWLDIELAANPRRKQPMRHLQAFANVVSGFVASNNSATLGSFLEWLDFAESREKLEVPAVTPEAGVIQVMTVHAAKGLQWDHVAIANLIDKDFPADPSRTGDWLRSGQLPYPLRGDSDSLPNWNYLDAETGKEADTALAEFKADCREHALREERRLIYVAVTRPKQSLLLTGSYWKPGSDTAREPSGFLIEAAQHLGLPDFAPTALRENPLNDRPAVEWPLPPLGVKHAERVAAAAELTEKQIDLIRSMPQLVAQERDTHDRIDLLLMERDAAAKAISLVDAPVRISASRFKDFVKDASTVAERIRRPMPQKPYRSTRTGTLFHAWVEQRFGISVLDDRDADFEDALLESDNLQEGQDAEPMDLGNQTEAIERLQANFERSRWSKLTPLEIEREIQLTVDNHTFVCKIDAVFKTEQGVEIIDWKTGKPPKDAEDLADRSLQLALYRLAYSRFSGIPENQIECSLYFADIDREVKPDLLLSGDEILEAWQRVLEEFV